MRGALLHAPGDVRLEQREDATIIQPTDAIIRLSATCICGSDLWPYRGIEAVQGPANQASPASRASTIACARLRTCSFWKMRVM